MQNKLNTISFSGELLIKMKNDGIGEERLALLKKKADALLSSPRYAVTERIATAASGNKHDYCSIGTYWWPNPDTPDGLPYVRRDGETTPAAKDPISYDAMADKALTLALAAFYFDNKEYAVASEKTIYDWHLNPETYMTPHAEYSQAIPGICTGRGIGVIDFSMRSYKIFDAVGILDYLGCISEENLTALKKWYSDFTDWMLTSEKGLTEECELNNHGTYYDVHVLSAAIFTDRPELAKKICTTAYARRIRSQIEPDGAQPLELARTMAMIYSLSNLRAFTLLANIADACGYSEYWGYDEKFGAPALKKAIDFIYPYFKNPEAFPYQEINPSGVPRSMLDRLMTLSAHFESEGYAERADEILKTVPDYAADWFYIPLK